MSEYAERLPRLPLTQIDLPHPCDLPSHPQFKYRLKVPHELRDWKVDYRDYNPPTQTFDKVLQASVPDQADPEWSDMTATQRQAHTELFQLMGLEVDPERGPRNPAGRTGFAGRGNWYRYGPNFSANCMAFTVYEDVPYVLAIVRKDSKMLAFPGGRLGRKDAPDIEHYTELYDPRVRHQISLRTMWREVQEEAGLDLTEWTEYIDGQQLIYSGITNGPRAADEAWAHADDRMVRFRNLSSLPRVVGGSDALAALWVPATQQMTRSDKGRLVHSHQGQLLRAVDQPLPEAWTEQQLNEIFNQVPEETRGIITQALAAQAHKALY